MIISEISREYTFDSAHQLSHHHGKCFNLHGHTYRLQVSITGRIVDSTKPTLTAVRQVAFNERALHTASPTSGMVIDFGDLDDIVKPFVELLDHGYISGMYTPWWLADLWTQELYPIGVALRKLQTEPGINCVQERITRNELGKVTILPIEYTTAELLAVWFANCIRERMIQVLGDETQGWPLKIELWETPKSCVTYVEGN